MFCFKVAAAVAAKAVLLLFLLLQPFAAAKGVVIGRQCIIIYIERAVHQLAPCM